MADDAPKPKAPPPPRPPIKDDRDLDDGPKAPSPKQNDGAFSTSVSRAVIISTIMICSVWLFLSLMSLDRYRVVPSNNTNAISVFRIDQLKGDVHICTPQACTLVEIKPVSGD
jgi:hypothetical protein